jgi:hypothetical protein
MILSVYAMHFIYKTPDAIICITVNIQEKYKQKTKIKFHNGCISNGVVLRMNGNSTSFVHISNKSLVLLKVDKLF